MRYTQDESYYLLDAEPGSCVYLGLRPGVDREEMLGDLQAGQDGMFRPEPDYDFFDGKKEFDRPEWPRMHFIEQRYANDPTNWWVANHAGVVSMLRSAGLSVVSRPGQEIYLCEPTRLHEDHPPLRWDPAELDSACGRYRAAPAKRPQ